MNMISSSLVRRLCIPVACTLVLGSCSKPMHDITIRSADNSKTVTMKVEVAQTPDERTQGLMNRKELKPGEGMLFVFPEPQSLSFWMKNTLIPLDILFFDTEGHFINATQMQPCTQDPCPRYSAEALGQYVIEVGKGFRIKNGIGVGWKLDLKEIAAFAKPE